MKVFVSWSGEPSQKMALALKDWLPLVLQYVEPWLSDADISAGSRWADTIAVELETSNFGIICVTKENLHADWINFEAGALSKSIEESKVVPLLLDAEFSDLSGTPLGQFQAKLSAKTGIRDIVSSINQSATTPLDETRLKRSFDSLWPELEKSLSEIPKQKTVTKTKVEQADVLENLVRQMSALEATVREQSVEHHSTEQKPRPRNYEVAKALRTAIEEKRPFGEYGGLLVYSSVFRSEFPWISDTMQAAYEGLTSGDDIQFKKGKVLIEVLRDAFKNPEITMKLMENSSRGLKRILHEMAELFDMYYAQAKLIGSIPKKAD